MITFERTIAVLFAAGLMLLPLPGSAPAGCRAVAHHRQQQQAAVVFQQAYPVTYYSVGQNLQLRAMVQQELQALLAQAQSQPQQLVAPPCPDGTCPTPQTLPLTAAPDRWALVKANCAGCHSTNEKAMSYVDMTDLSMLTCEQKLACMAAMLDNKMPKGKSIDPQTFANILGEFSGAETAHQP